jgi:protein-tyrosine kinase
MGLMLDALKQVDAPTPVILPLSRADERGMPNDDGSASAATAGSGQSAQHSAFSVQDSSIQRFSFPELPEAPAPPAAAPALPNAPTVVWPECRNSETASACGATASAILRQLSLERPTVLAFTSPCDGDGKTSLLIDLAPPLARQIAGNVLAVDANFRKPSLTARLGMPAGETAARSVLIYPTNLPRLNVLPAPPKPLSRRFDRSWIEELREGWPLVLLDMASLAYAEAAPLTRFCDGVYLVVRVGYTSQRAVTEAAQVIRNAGGRLLGCVAVE